MNVKPGDLAIVVHAIATPENIGKIVTVIGPAGPNDVGDGYVGPMWFVGCDSGLVVESMRDVKRIVKQRVMRDNMLKPVSGLPDEQHTEEHNKQEA